MHSFKELSVVDRAKLLHQLFPEEIIAFIVFTKYFTATFERNKEQLKNEWQKREQLFTFEFWSSLAANIRRSIKRYENDIASRSGMFSNRLFGGYNSLFSAHCLFEFIKSGECENKKFAQAVALFFQFN